MSELYPIVAKRLGITAEEKAKSIGIHYDGIFVSEEIGRGELKPSKSAMEYMDIKVFRRKIGK
ncbi:MAG: hypothetical protein ACI4S2_15375 [Lachnospiraceae bacterium]